MPQQGEVMLRQPGRLWGWSDWLGEGRAAVPVCPGFSTVLGTVHNILLVRLGG